LFLILQAERGGWAGPSADPKTGHWAVSFNREIRAFRQVADIDDYWSRRFKPWKAARSTPTPAGSANVSSSSKIWADLLSANPAVLADVLLQPPDWY
jgi:hypothetical protein